MIPRPPRLLLALLLLACAPLPARAQTASSSPPPGGWAPLAVDGNGIAGLARVVRAEVRGGTLGDAVRRILADAQVGVAFDPDLPGLDRPVAASVAGLRAADALLRVLRGSGLRLLVNPRGQAVLTTAPRQAPETGSVAGTVRGGGGEAVAGARVTTVGRSAVTADDGRFTLGGLAPGRHPLEVRRLGYETARVDVEVAAGAAARLQLTLRPATVPLAAVVVAPSWFGVMDHGADAPRTLTREDLETRPQIGEDVFRAVSRIPGVASTDLSAAFRVRGGRNEELFVMLDGMTLLEPFHIKDFDGALSIVDVNAVRGIDLVTGGFGAEYGDRLTGVFDMRSVSPAPGAARTTLGLSLTNLRAMSAGSWAAGRGRWVASARRGYLDLALDLSRARGSDRGDISPTYYDALAKVEYDVAPGHTLAAHALLARDRLRFQDTDDAPELQSRYGSSYGWITWTAQVGRLSARTLASVARLTWSRAGESPHSTAGTPDLRVDDARDLSSLGIRHDAAWELSPRALVKWGMEARRDAAEYDYFRVQRDGAGLDTTTVGLSPAGTALGGYAALRVRPAMPLTVEGGLRYDRGAGTGEGHAAPRASAVLQLGPATRLRGAWGGYVQAQGLHELQVQDGAAAFFPAERAEHRIVGIERAAGNGVTLRAEAYQRLLTHVRPRWLNLGNPITDVFPEALGDRVRFAPVRGRAEGVELQARRESGRRLAWAASYTLARAEDRDSSGRWVPRALDQRHAVALDLAWRPRPAWRLSTAWQYHTGWPASPLQQSAATLPDGSIAITRSWGRLNSLRLPAYHRLDARISREWTRRSGRIQAYLDLFNLYDRANARAIDPFAEVRNGQVVLGQGYDEMIPFVPSFGVSWEF
ncbi:MAG: TonB-dependent receptor domain-containing protein [Longimicrobiaceae bacterium]